MNMRLKPIAASGFTEPVSSSRTAPGYFTCNQASSALQLIAHWTSRCSICARNENPTRHFKARSHNTDVPVGTVSRTLLVPA